MQASLRTSAARFLGCSMALGPTVVLVLGVVSMFGCSTSNTPTPDGGGGVDMGVADGGSDVDALMSDAAQEDGGTVDLGTDTIDAGPRPDAGMCVDLPPDPTRPVAVQCSPCRPPMTMSGGTGACMSDADCVAGTNGRCGFGRIGTFCTYDLCFKDEDCADTEACLCDASGGGNACVPAECRVNADCGTFACSPTFGTCGHYSGFVAYRCHRATDACATDADCGLGYCAFDEILGSWQCSTSECAG